MPYMVLRDSFGLPITFGIEDLRCTQEEYDKIKALDDGGEMSWEKAESVLGATRVRDIRGTLEAGRAVNVKITDSPARTFSAQEEK